MKKDAEGKGCHCEEVPAEGGRRRGNPESQERSFMTLDRHVNLRLAGGCFLAMTTLSSATSRHLYSAMLGSYGLRNNSDNNNIPNLYPARLFLAASNRAIAASASAFLARCSSTTSAGARLTKS